MRDSTPRSTIWNLKRFPLKAMAKAGWIPNVSDLKDRAEELIGGLIERAGGQRVATAPLYRKKRPTPDECQDGRVRSKSMVLAGDGHCAGKLA